MYPLLIALQLVLLAYWIIRHMVFGAGKIVRSIDRLCGIAEKMNSYDGENITKIEKARKCSTVSFLWKSYYRCYLSGKKTSPEKFFSYDSLSSISGYKGSYAPLVLIALTGTITFVYAFFESKLSMNEQLMLLLISLTVVGTGIILSAILKSLTAKSACRFATILRSITPEPEKGDINYELIEALSNLTQKLSSASNGRSSGVKDIEVQVIESIIEACLRRMDSIMGEKFERLNNSIESSVKAQYNMIARLNSALEKNDFKPEK